MTTSYHICVPIRRALEELKKGNNLLNCTPSKALKELTDAENEGKTYYAGCDNMTSEGRCAGHQEAQADDNPKPCMPRKEITMEEALSDMSREALQALCLHALTHGVPSGLTPSQMRATANWLMRETGEWYHPDRINKSENWHPTP